MGLTRRLLLDRGRLVPRDHGRLFQGLLIVVGHLPQVLGLTTTLEGREHIRTWVLLSLGRCSHLLLLLIHGSHFALIRLIDALHLKALHRSSTVSNLHSAARLLSLS